ncbi:hypothetical protein RKE25_02910 [Dyella sp. BiH032]|uniref:hypothetical protein n=1 Tax=Dyella sp. BiH032 TaxID=3075430 RepID=UPI00289328F6|nr:hypothetical protein [Dyella sp. BiH032]WNL46606.1 hypothetical protein RKE25_02910 [Dyella sp. BiH032]
MARISRAFPAVSAALLVGCLHVTTQSSPPPSGSANWHAVLPEGTARYQLAMGEVSSGAAPDRRVNPIYPPSLLSRCPPPVEVRAWLVVDASGKVADVRADDEASANADRRSYIDAVKVAARQWSFVPLKIDRWAADANGESHVVDSETRPFSLAYDFRFECHSGAAQVTTGDAPSASGHGSE